VSEEALAGFARSLRDAGLAVGPGRVVDFCRAAALLAPDDLYHAGAATLVSDPAGLRVYDETFRRFFGGAEAAGQPRLRIRVRAVEGEVGLASAREILRAKSFARCTTEELAEIARLMAALELRVPERRTRRRAPAARGTPDLRRTLRRALRSGGEPVELAFRARRRRRRRLILFLDVSGSMDAHARALLLFAHAVLRGRRDWEAFCFGTRLTRLTRALEGADPDEALARATEEVFDWGGGTRIGESLERFLAQWGHGGLARGAVVLVCSDGLEVGDPEHLAAQMRRLARLAHRIVWLNPLREHPDYEPLARGMQAALPSVDLFASGHSLASLEEVAAALAEL
jgi:uncharacterized protein with von Willebrand factor type A (vWA) domain